MKKNECNKNINCYSKVSKLLSSSRTAVDLGSNMQMKFNICDSSPLTCNSKIEILETKLYYNLSKIEKNILVNGHNLLSNNNYLLDSFILKNEYINLPNGNYNKVLLSVTEEIRLKISIKLKLKVVSHNEYCEDVYIDAFGESEDYIETVLMTSSCMPNYKCSSKDTYLDIENILSAEVNPNFIFLSPVYDYDSNINGFLGNIFINYCLGIHTLSYIYLDKSSLERNSYLRSQI